MTTQNVDKINAYFLNIKRQSSFLSMLCNFFESQKIEFGFLGGAVRMAITNSTELPRDLDIVFDSDDKEFDIFLRKNNIEFRKNAFGGRKIRADNLLFDIWSLEHHHLISEKKYAKDFRNISRTTFINYDSVFYNWTNQKLFGDYTECMETHLIDFVGNKKYQKYNTQSDITICKLALLEATGYSLSEDIKKYISDYVKSYFEDNSLFCKEEYFDSFVSNYTRHCGNKLDSKKREVIFKFIMSYL